MIRTVRVLGVDWGDRKIGLAVSDPSGTVAVGAGTLVVSSRREALAALAAAATARDVERIVVGFPVSMSGSSGPRAEKTERFVEALRARVAIPILLWDERLTTAAALRTLRETGGSTRRDRGLTDELAATILLQSWLDARRTSRDGSTAPSEDGEPPTPRGGASAG